MDLIKRMPLKSLPVVFMLYLITGCSHTRVVRVNAPGDFAAVNQKSEKQTVYMRLTSGQRVKAKHLSVTPACARWEDPESGDVHILPRNDVRDVTIQSSGLVSIGLLGAAILGAAVTKVKDTKCTKENCIPEEIGDSYARIGKTIGFITLGALGWAVGQGIQPNHRYTFEWQPDENIVGGEFQCDGSFSDGE